MVINAAEYRREGIVEDMRCVHWHGTCGMFIDSDAAMNSTEHDLSNPNVFAPIWLAQAFSPMGGRPDLALS